jgi:hypothetical protein
MISAQPHFAGNSLQELQDNIADPAADFSMIPFWFWNDTLDESRIASQLTEMLVKKIKAVCIHPMPNSFRKEDFIEGMPEDYLGVRFMECIRFTVLQAGSLGMKVWLYDEGGWPSGLALGLVVERNPEFAQKTLHLNHKTGEISIVKNNLRTDILNPDATKAFIDITYEKYKSTVGEFFGETVTGIFTDEPNIAGHIDSYDIPWTERLPDFFRKIKNYDLMPCIRALFKNPVGFEKRQIHKIRYDFCDVISRLFAESYFKPISEWCTENRIRLVGHLDRDHAIAEHLSGGYSSPRLLQYYDIPGVDCIWRQIFPDKPQIDFPKFASSVAHTRNRRFALSESFGAYGFGLTFSQMKHLVDVQFVRGINLLVPHAFHYSSKGPRAFGVNSNLFLADPRWSYFKEFSQYVSRLSYLMTLGKSSANVGLYYPIAGLWTEGIESDLAGTIIGDFEKASDCLMRRQVEFDYIDDDAFLSDKTKIQNGTCILGEGKYQCFVLPAGSVYRADVLNLFDAFVASGGTIVLGRMSFSETLFDTVQGKRPFLEGIKEAISQGCRGGIKKWGQGKIVFADNIEDILGKDDIVPRCVELSEANEYIKVNRRVSDHYAVFLMVNESGQEQKIGVDFKCKGSAFTVDVENALFQNEFPASSGLYNIVLPAGGSRLVVFDKMSNLSEYSHIQRERPQASKVNVFPVLWNCRVIRQYAFRGGEIVSVPLNYELAEKSGTTPWLADFKDSFSGTMEYSGVIHIPAKGANKNFMLHFGDDVRDCMFRVWVNEKYAGSRVWSPFELNIGSFVNAGENRIRITVSNTLENLIKLESVVSDLKDLGWFNGYMKKISRMCSEG